MRAAVVGAAVAVAAAGSGVPAARATPAPAVTLQVGSQVLHRCGPAWCGRIEVPLDRAVPAGPWIPVAFRWYPATDRSTPALGTVLPVEGGPGYPSSQSVGFGSAGGYAAMYGPLLEHRNLLSVDLRGTGSSAVIDCPALQAWHGPTASTGYEAAVAGCAAAVDAGHPVPGARASSLFGSAEAAADVATVVTALGAGPVDLYGDSYGSWFAQVLAARYPSLVSDVVLDSTYPVLHLDPWYRSTIAGLRAGFRIACSRAPACRAGQSDGWAPVEALAARLRRAPVSGTVPGPAGRLVPVSVDVIGLVDLVNDAAEDTTIYRELDAAAGALLGHGDPDALLRLYAQRTISDESYFGIPATSYSAGLYQAVSCVDYPQLFDMGAAPPERAAQLDRAVAGLPAATFAPFTTREWIAQDQNTEDYSGCLRWPVPVGAVPPVAGRPPLLPPRMPVLVLGGQLDAWTPPSGVPQVLAELGGRSRLVVLANSTHVVAEGDLVGCATSLLRRFVEDPGALDRLDASCAPAVPPVHVQGAYAEHADQAPPIAVSAASGRPPSALQRALATVALETAGDAVSRWQATGSATDTGLHGGRVRAGGGRLDLDADQLVPGAPVTGVVRVQGDRATADVTATAGGTVLVVHATWAWLGPVTATVSATAPGTAFTGTAPAP